MPPTISSISAFKQNITGTLEVKVATGQAIRLTVTRPVPQRPDYHIIGSELQVITYRDYGQPVPVVVPTWYTVQPSGAPS